MDPLCKHVIQYYVTYDAKSVIQVSNITILWHTQSKLPQQVMTGSLVKVCCCLACFDVIHKPDLVSNLTVLNAIYITNNGKDKQSSKSLPLFRVLWCDAITGSAL